MKILDRRRKKRSNEKAMRLVSSLIVVYEAKCELCHRTVQYKLPEFPAGWVISGRSRFGDKYAYPATWGSGAWWCGKCKGSRFAAGNDGISRSDWIEKRARDSERQRRASYLLGKMEM